ncbi:hypothetical protein N5J48_06060 [Acinetobacter ursingii]|uniref:Uncharacterized protein n=2 Tax=Acinetobacter TaxID=469 RepID=N9DJ13_9GAMM|nr:MULTISPECIES: hypothetical protein [Acinetobacter]ENV80463.1 hypothetical protein F942_00631 [Acinetobacter ursingii ANC 3649]EXD34123.1 putative membrane protein [Acinetobacter sp. 479375]MCH2006551.1 hypothetical protein [Acinetobacter ursingii]MCU4489072.1 hypothetical protein [Acinetobacter ursingii]MCU4497857.1 hypothetical protein [Acinetobacter ursingii]
MSNSDQDHMFNILDKQRKNQLKVDRILKIVLPLTAFLLSVICANLNWQSTLGTFVILTLAFLAVGIQRQNLWIWLLVLVVYCGLDNYLSFGQFNLIALRLQLGSMLLFTLIIGIGRPYIDRWFMKSSV